MLDLSCRQSVEDFEVRLKLIWYALSLTPESQAGSYVVASVYENERRKTPFSEFTGQK